MYPGGKGATWRQIVNQMPPHNRYFELFVGDGAVMRNKLPAFVNVGIDRDVRAVTAVRDGIRCSIATNGDRRGQWLFCVGDALDFLGGACDGFGHGDLIYLDPPYLMSTRRSQRPLYACEFGDEADHLRLLTAVKKLRCRVLLSGYWSDLYANELAGWRAITFQAVTRAGTLATEWLWMNYSEPVRLHDYRYLGEDFRERERVKRKAKRWVAGLGRLPVLEQRAILAEMEAAGLVD